MEPWSLFLLLSIPVIILSWQPLLHPKSHGFPRFFAWEGMLWLLVNNYRSWFHDPFSMHQVFSWLLLITSIYPAVAGFLLLHRQEKSGEERSDKALYDFEKTTSLVQHGIYKFIRHPLYTSLLLLNWGILLKNPRPDLIAVAVAVSILLYLTARRDEKECITFFGEPYREYMKKSRMFLPFVF